MHHLAKLKLLFSLHRYMEQTVAKAIIAAMTSCSDFKPKYPYVNAYKSALLYVGYHLKGKCKCVM